MLAAHMCTVVALTSCFAKGGSAVSGIICHGFSGCGKGRLLETGSCPKVISVMHEVLGTLHLALVSPSRLLVSISLSVPPFQVRHLIESYSLVKKRPRQSESYPQQLRHQQVAASQQQVCHKYIVDAAACQQASMI